MSDAPQPFNLGMMDYEVLRKDKRHKILVLSAPFIALLALTALWLLLPTTLTKIALNDYKKGHYASARNVISPLSILSPNAFVRDFDRGTIDAQVGKYDISKGELTKAVAEAPNKKQQCMAVKNLDAVLKATSTNSDLLIKQHPDCFDKSAVKKANDNNSGGSGAQTLSPQQQIQLAEKQQAALNLQDQNSSGQTASKDNWWGVPVTHSAK